MAAWHGFTVRYRRTSRLLHALALARADGSFTALLRSLAKINLLIIDDWMRDPITLANAQDILEVLDDRFGYTATLIASQAPVSDWHLRIPDPTLADAILDRLVHNAQRIELRGESQRKLRDGRSMPNTYSTIPPPALSSPLTVRYAPVYAPPGCSKVSRSCR